MLRRHSGGAVGHPSPHLLHRSPSAALLSYSRRSRSLKEDVGVQKIYLAAKKEAGPRS